MATWWSEALLLTGRADEAAAVGQRALDLAVQRNERAQEAYARRLFGEIASHDSHHDLAEAERHYRLAMSLAEDRGMRPLVTHCRFGLGKLFCRLERPQDVREHLTAAAAMYREVDMDYWLEKATALASSDEQIPATGDVTWTGCSRRLAE